MATPWEAWSVGEPKDDMMRVLAHVALKMPENKPRYLMGGVHLRIWSKVCVAVLICLIA